MEIKIEFSGNLFDKLAQKGLLKDVMQAGEIEAVIQNRQRHAIVAEFGSGIYNDGTGPKEVIKAKNGIFTIPVVDKYAGKLSSDTLREARQNAIEYPDILSKLKAGNRGLIGFIFRSSFKGMKPIRMVRGTKDAAVTYMLEEMQKTVTYLLQRAFQRTLSPRDLIARSVNKTAAFWMREIIKKSPVLTSNLKTGWTITKLAN